MANGNSKWWIGPVVTIAITVGAVIASYAAQAASVRTLEAGQAKLEEKKLDKAIFEQDQSYKNQQFQELKAYLIRIEAKVDKQGQ